MSRLIFVLFTIFCFAITSFGQDGTSRMNLKVLFVGYDPSKPMPESKRSYPGGMSKEGFTADYPRRMPAFKNLLSRYFTNVKTIDCRDWRPADSDPYDVTIFDFNPNPIVEAKQEKNADGITKYIPAKYLPDNFSKPVIFIANTAPQMGASLGLKLDWLCLCLDADAHHVKDNHPIFRGPIQKVKLTMGMKKTPDGIYHYTTGDKVPKQIPMWTVQNGGYVSDPNMRIGLVARGNRFAEGPDAEVISSGVNTKDVGAVALGRHGNFFLWGFGASPFHMTEEAKLVFVNTVAYMKQFDKKAPITRKYNDRMATTDDVRETFSMASKAKYEEYKKMLEEFNLSSAKQKKKIDDKKASGQELTSSELEALTYLGREQPIESWEKFLQRTMGPYATRFGQDASAYQKYMTDNFDYLYCDPEGFWKYSIDEDVQAIGVSNHKIALLDSCIAMLKRNYLPELALRVLQRYTGESFSSPKQWDDWLSKNRRKLYFTETDGYRFKINTYN